MVGLVIFNGLFLFGLYTALKFKMQKQEASVEKEKNLKAINLLMKNYKIRNGSASVVEKLQALQEFEKACDEFVESQFASSEARTGENVTRLSDYIADKEQGIKKAGH